MRKYDNLKDTMDLKDTIDLMVSEDYKDRYIAELLQIRIRILKLQKMLNNWDKLSFTPTCEKSVYLSQIDNMYKYYRILIKRARMEQIEIPWGLDE